MLKHSWARAIIWLLLVGPPMIVCKAAAEVLVNDSPFIIDVWETGPGEQKLPQSSVISIIQTRDGYIWLGTLNGLVRFDGVRFTVFDVANTPELECNQIIHLFEDNRQNLWVGTETAGVLLVNHSGQIRNLGLGRGHREQRLVSACEDARGGVWLRTAEGELVRFRNGTPDRVNIKARAVITEKSGPIWLGVEWADPQRQKIEERLISVVAVSNSATFAVEREMPVEKLDYLLAAHDGGFWLLADGRVQKWKNAGRELDWGAYPWNSKHAPITSACEDQHGNLIVATLGEGVFWYDSTGHATQISTAQGLSHNFILSLCLDREGDLWVGTDGGGLNRVKRRVFGVGEK